MFDSHCHLTDERFRGELLETIQRATRRGLTGLVTIASDLKDTRAAIELTEGSERFWCTAGVHPHEVSNTTSSSLKELSTLASNNANVVALGETGLDFHYNNTPKELQKEWFRSHLTLSRDLELPTVVHSRDAEDDTIRIIGEFRGSVDFVLHCFSGGLEFLRAGLTLGGYISFSGLITFSNVQMDEVIKCVPEDRLLVETDSPYLAPTPYRGKRNEPSYLQEIIEKIARVRNMDIQEVAQITTVNAKRFYDIKV